ncbi:MAG: holo-ACP synthase [Phycisphaerales bacterium]
MQIVGHGIDLVEVARIEKMLADHGAHFEQRVFTSAEIAYASGRPKRRAEHLAARFAMKEAVLKALGTGWRGGIRWTDVEVQSDALGKPTVALAGEAAELARARGATAWMVSISHAGGFAMASAIASGAP